MDYSLPGSSVHGISQARVLEWDAISFSRGSRSHHRCLEQISPDCLQWGRWVYCQVVISAVHKHLQQGYIPSWETTVLIYKKQLLILKVLSRDGRNSVTNSSTTSNSSSLANSTISALTPLLKSWMNPSKSFMKVEINFFKVLLMLMFWPLPLNQECSSWYKEYWILSRRSSVYFPQIHQRNH